MTDSNQTLNNEHSRAPTEKELKHILSNKHPVGDPGKLKELPARELEAHQWVEIRLFMSSTFVDTHGERDLLIKKILPALNEKLKESFIRIVPIDLRWGVSAKGSKNCEAIQTTCLNEVDHCRVMHDDNVIVYPYFLGLRTNRYGWVQDDLMDSTKYDKPKFYDWVNALKEHAKKVSITSLECIHAALPLDVTLPSPAIFFYERFIENPEDINELERWIFEFEYKAENVKIKPEVEKQYQRRSAEEVETYKNDKVSLNEWLKSLPHVKYDKYSCVYEDGGVQITGDNNGKKFGIGRVSGLKKLEEMITADLLDSIDKNFVRKAEENLSVSEKMNIPFEIAVKEKSSTFFGRKDLVDELYKHCENSEGPNINVVVGKPGCGKSALVSHVADKCMKELRKDGHFVFVHGVDTCPQSNDLEDMLLRLHNNICEFTGSTNSLLTASDLKAGHVSQLEKIARDNSDKNFIIIVDAVNQMYPDMNAWSMWWVSSEASPSNLRFLLSTLYDEHNTYNNTLKQRPDAHVVEVKEMSEEGAKEMVTNILQKYNKELTTTDEPFLGNQMGFLLEKNTSPLYLATVCEALRTQGVFEKMTEYIKQLPDNVQDLFQFLLESWEETYGKDFVSLVVSVITLSRDGLQETVISQILTFIEEQEQKTFESSFSTVYAVLRGFLSSGGGGYLHFFHDLLNQVVRKNYLTPEFEGKIHDYLSRFYLSELSPFLSKEIPKSRSNHHDDHLRHIVYHQIEAGKYNQQPPKFTETLRSIYFVREKIVAEQTVSLSKEYLHALKSVTTDETLKSKLMEWRKFVSIYSSFIEEFPKHYLNYVINQIPSSHVYQDTVELLTATDDSGEVPMCWVNKPQTERNDVIVKYNIGSCGDCAITSADDNLVACSLLYGRRVLVYEQDSGELLHQVHLKNIITSLHFVKKEELWCGDYGGIVYVVDISTGRVVWEEKLGGESRGVTNDVKWLCQVGDNMACGLYKGTITLVSIATKQIVNTLKTDENSGVTCYSTLRQQFVTGHMHAIKCWSHDGQFVSEVKVDGRVASIDAHPVDPNIVVCKVQIMESSGAYTQERKAIQVNLRTGEQLWENLKVSNSKDDIRYVGDRMVACVGEDNKTIISLNPDDGAPIGSISKAHLYNINGFSLISSNIICSAGDDGFLLSKIPSPEEQIEVMDAKEGEGNVVSCVVVGENFVLLRSMSERVWLDVLDAHTLNVIESFDIDVKLGERSKLFLHPINENMLLLTTERNLVLLEKFKIVKVHDNILNGAVQNSNFDRINGITMSTDGLMCVISAEKTGAIVLDMKTMDNINIVSIFNFKYQDMYSSDIHRDCKRVVSAGRHGLAVWECTTSQGQEVTKVDSKMYTFVRILYDPDRMVCVDIFHKITIRNFDNGEVLHELKGQHRGNFSILDNTWLVSGVGGNPLLVTDVNTGKPIYKFYHHSSKEFKSFAFHKETRTLVGLNENEMMYVLKDFSPN